MKTNVLVLGGLMLLVIQPARSDAANLLVPSDEPRVYSWFTDFAGKYARIYTNDAAKTSGNAIATWSNGTQTQSLPAYCGVQEIYSSDNWAYIRTTGLGSHTMGPWYLNAARTQVFPNWPANRKAMYRVPRNPTVPGTKTLTGNGAIGYFVDGVAMFDSRDAFYWNGSTEVNGTGSWNRDAYVNEGLTFDPGYAHQEQTGTHHYHANPIALRYLLGDNVVFNPATRTYSENTTNANPRHSPILGWVRDGFPVYGPYAFSNATNANSGVRRMISGFQLRNGQNGSDDLRVTGRVTIPQWAVRLYNVSSNQSGPTVSTTYPLGRYMEDNVYLGDIGKAQGVDFDLDEYNGRFCVTPEFPGGTYAYFVNVSSNGTPMFPYNIGRAFYGNPTGGAVTTLTETVITNFVGETNLSSMMNPPSIAAGTVTVTWSGVEGGTYKVESSSDLSSWNVVASNLTTQATIGSVSTPASLSNGFYRVSRTAVASFDPVSSGATGGGGGNGIVSVSPTSGARGSTLTLTINLDPSVNPPPQAAPIISVTVGTITGTSNVHVSQTQVTSSITIPGGATTGPQTVTVTFPAPPGGGSQVVYTLTNGFTIQ